MRTMPDTFHRILDRFKTQEMCDKVVKVVSSSLQFVLDWSVTREWIDMWYDDYYDYDADHWDDDDEDKFFEWYDGYKKHKAQKASIKEELLLVAWNSIKALGLVYVSRWKKRDRKIVSINMDLFVFDDQIQKTFLT